MQRSEDCASCVVSVVIPVYNTFAYVERAVASCLAQTHDAVEVICVDDGSSDGSGDVLGHLKQSDSRVKTILFDRNRGAHAARAAGVSLAGGSIITFLDSDDELEPGTCRRIVEEMVDLDCDILHLGSKVINDGGVPDDQVTEMSSWLDPRFPILEGRAITSMAYDKYEYSYNVCGKAFRADLAKRAFSALGDRFVGLGEDGYEYFALAYFADVYRGIPHSEYYVYHYGVGVTGRQQQSKNEFARTLQVRQAVDGVRAFLVEQNALDEYEDTFLAYGRKQLSYLFAHWFGDVREGDKLACMRAILQQWDQSDIMVELGHYGTPGMRYAQEALGEEYPCSSSAAWAWGFADGAASVRDEYERSLSYKLGRVLTALPRKFLGRG